MRYPPLDKLPSYRQLLHPFNLLTCICMCYANYNVQEPHAEWLIGSDTYIYILLLLFFFSSLQKFFFIHFTFFFRAMNLNVTHING